MEDSIEKQWIKYKNYHFNVETVNGKVVFANLSNSLPCNLISMIKPLHHMKIDRKSKKFNKISGKMKWFYNNCRK